MSKKSGGAVWKVIQQKNRDHCVVCVTFMKESLRTIDIQCNIHNAVGSMQITHMNHAPHYTIFCGVTSSTLGHTSGAMALRGRISTW